MKLASTALLSFALSGALTFTGLSWPRYVRPGWFQLEGQPRAVDGQPVQDWQHVNEVLARMAAATCTPLRDLHVLHATNRTAGEPPEPPDRLFTLDYIPAAGDNQLRQVVVRQRVPGRVLWADQHPIFFACHEVVAGDPPVTR